MLTGKDAIWTSTSTALLCPVNLPNEEKLVGREKLAHGGSQDKEKLLTNASSPSLRRGRATVNSVSDCQKHTLYSYYYCCTSRRGEQPSAKFTRTSTTTIVYRGMYYTSTRNWMEERLHSYYIFKM